MKRTTTTSKAYLQPPFALSTHLDPISHGETFETSGRRNPGRLLVKLLEAQSKAVDRNLFWCRLRVTCLRSIKERRGR